MRKADESVDLRAIWSRVPVGEDPVSGLELGEQVGRQYVRQYVARAQVDPAVLVHLPAEELLPVGSLVADELGPLDEGRLVD